MDFSRVPALWRWGAQAVGCFPGDNSPWPQLLLRDVDVQVLVGGFGDLGFQGLLVT